MERKGHWLRLCAIQACTPTAPHVRVALDCTHNLIFQPFLQYLQKICGNVRDQPEETKYRKVGAGAGKGLATFQYMHTFQDGTTMVARTGSCSWRGP